MRVHNTEASDASFFRSFLTWSAQLFHFATMLQGKGSSHPIVFFVWSYCCSKAAGRLERSFAKVITAKYIPIGSKDRAEQIGAFISLLLVASVLF
jgi:hypothetical protein